MMQLIYLPVTPTPDFKSFAAPILNLQDAHVTAPWFGANKWSAKLQPVYGGGIPADYGELELVITFKEGGAFDFHTSFERLKERLRHAVEIARESGQAIGDGTETGGGRGGGALAGVNLDNVHLEDLPTYQESRNHSIPSAISSPSAARAPEFPRDPTPQTSPQPQQERFEPPTEPPPGYEEVQREGVADELERRLRSAEREG
jgi:hypothetical protein